MAKKEGQLALNAKPAQEAYANVAKANDVELWDRNILISKLNVSK